jgi:hypothetical protein
MGAYYFIDNVSLVPSNGGSFTLPANFCVSQTIPNLNVYLNGLPTNGVFAGDNVYYNGSTYVLNDTKNLTPGLHTISYTYTNTSGCSVTVYSNIMVETPITPTISGVTSACSGNTTIHNTTIPTGYTAQWSVVGGTIVGANNQPTVSVNWTSFLCGGLSLTFTSSSGCVVYGYQQITNQCACDCLSTIYYTNTITGNTANFTVLNTNSSCSSMNDIRYSWSFDDGISLNSYNSTQSHSYSTNGTYTVKLTPNLLCDNDEVLCTRKYIPSTITISGAGRVVNIEKNKIFNNEIIVYPNPASSKINADLNLKKRGDVTMVIRTIEGKELSKQTWYLNKGKQTLEVELPNNISDGIIFIEIISDEIREVKTVLIKR